MKIAVRADGGANIGMGHLVRCSAIASEALRQGHDIRFFVRETSASWLISRALSVHVLPCCDSIEQETGAFISAACHWGAGLALCDSYELTQCCYERIQEAMGNVVIDDIARLPYTALTLINSNLYAQGLNYSDCAVAHKLLGGRYTILREEFRQTPLPIFREQAQRLLITMGGSDPNHYTQKVLHALTNVRGVQIVVVLGPNSCSADSIGIAAHKCASPVEILRAPNNIAEVFASCDLAISAAGSTSYELCALGIPSILIAQACNQALILDYFTQNGPYEALGFFDKIKMEQIESSLCSLLHDAPRRREMRESAQRLVSLDGVSNIVREAFQ